MHISVRSCVKALHNGKGLAAKGAFLLEAFGVVDPIVISIVVHDDVTIGSMSCRIPCLVLLRSGGDRPCLSVLPCLMMALSISVLASRLLRIQPI